MDQNILTLFLTALILTSLSSPLTQLKHKSLLTQPTKPKWWQDAVIYEIFPKSFKDSKGDGVGDLQGIISKLDYLNDGTKNSLQVDAIWLTPFYKSPQLDNGYDVSDFTDVDPMFGTLQDFEELVKEAHKRGIKLLLDFVGNHSSDQHPWFIESRSSRNNPKSDWYYWRDPKPDGSPPNNWYSSFGGSVWSFDETRKQYYLHDFTKHQPCLNWRNPEVKKSMFKILDFWISKGADGFRFDAVAMMMKNVNFPDEFTWGKKNEKDFFHQEHEFDTGDPAIHPLIREIRSFIKSRSEDIYFIGEVTDRQPLRPTYLGNRKTGPEFDSYFFFDLSYAKTNAFSIRKVLEKVEFITKDMGWPNYFTGTHDNPRVASRRGRQHVRNLALILHLFRGTTFMYYGEELGMENNIKNVIKRKYDGIRSEKRSFQRRFCRTPLHWDRSPNAGFSTAMRKKLWLPVAVNYKQCNVQVQQKDPKSVLSLYKKLGRLKRSRIAFRFGECRIVDVFPRDILAFERSSEKERFLILVNFTDKDTDVRFKRFFGRIILSTELDRRENFEDVVFIRAFEGLVIKVY